jgi:glutathione synthase/RimK-type ligase-like ATP-grasp enzyme
MPKKPAPQIVVITDRQDAHLPFVQKHLKRQMVVIDPRTLLDGVELSYELEGDTMAVSYDGLRLDAVTGIWYRKPGEIQREDLNVPEELKTYSLCAMQYQITQILSCLQHAVWVSDHYTLRKANSKVWQLEVAARVGFNTPRTLVTSDSAKAREFIEQEGVCIVKAHMAYSPAYKDVRKSFLTTEISASNMPNLANLHLAPSIFQQYIKTAFDVRVTVIGEKVFAATIRTSKLDKNSKVRDWRIGHYQGEMQIEAYLDFPDEVARMCVEHTKAMGLRYGAIDLIMDTEGELWFVENNPNGQWAFVEDATGQPIGKAMAELLSSTSTKI